MPLKRVSSRLTPLSNNTVKLCERSRPRNGQKEQWWDFIKGCGKTVMTCVWWLADCLRSTNPLQTPLTSRERQHMGEPHVEVDIVGVFILYCVCCTTCMCVTALMCRLSYATRVDTYYTNWPTHQLTSSSCWVTPDSACESAQGNHMFHCLFLCCLTLSCISDRWSGCT